MAANSSFFRVLNLKLGARYYNPTTARFTQPDPAHTCGGYAYSDDNPANYIDPTDRDACTWIGVGLGSSTVWAGPGVSLGFAFFGATFAIGGMGSDCYSNPSQPTYLDFGVSEIGYGL